MRIRRYKSGVKLKGGVLKINLEKNDPEAFDPLKIHLFVCV